MDLASRLQRPLHGPTGARALPVPEGDEDFGGIDQLLVALASLDSSKRGGSFMSPSWRSLAASPAAASTPLAPPVMMVAPAGSVLMKLRTRSISGKCRLPTIATFTGRII